MRPDLEGNTVRFRDSRLEHNHSLECRPMFVVFNGLADIKPFQITYSFYADNLPRMNKGEVNILVKRDDLDVPNLPEILESKQDKPGKAQ
jgi:hypothetical protein